MGLNGLFCHSVLSAVANHFLLVGENYVTRTVHPLFRYSLHVLIASVLFYHELPKFRDTYYHDLGLPMTATHAEVLKSYDRIQEVLKTAAPHVVERLKRAYEVLSNQESRILYTLYGDIGIDAKTPTDFTVIMITVSLSYYMVSGMLNCVLNGSNRLRFARYVCVMYNAVAFFVEAELRFFYATFMRNVFYLNTLLPFQHIEFLRAVAPSVMLLASLVTHFFVADLDKLNMFLWQSTVATNTAILDKMSNVVSATEHLKTLGKDALTSPRDKLDGDDKDAGLGDFLEALDERQRKRLMDLVNSPDDKDKKGKFKFAEMLKPMVAYFVVFFVLRVFFK